MKILMIAPQPFFEPRGTPISVYQRLHALSQLGHEIDLLTFPIGEDVEIPRVKIHRTVRLPFIQKVKIGPSPAKLILDIFLFLKAMRMLLGRKYDVIHTHEEAAFFAMLLGIVFRVPHLYDMHSSLPKQLSNFGFGKYRPLVRLFEWLERAVFHTCSAAITIGADLEEHARSVEPDINYIRIENVPVDVVKVDREDNFEAIRARHEVSDRPLVVYTGNFEPYQGLDLLFASARRVIAAHPRVVFLIVGGEAKQIEAWRRTLPEMGLENNVIFTGTVSLHDSLDYIGAADILVSPRKDGLSVPLKLYSYMYSGKPTVATDVDAHTQILDESMAVIVDPVPEAYADGLCCLLDDPELCKQLGQKAKAYAEEEFSTTAYLSKIEQVYLSISLAKPIREIAQIPSIEAEARSAGTV